MAAGQGPAVPERPAIEVERVRRRFGEHTALDDVSLTVRQGEFFSLLGPSGCGKTTLLRILAGLDLPDAGSIRIGGVDAREIPAHRRPVNTVFQSYALFPHLSVRENVAFGLRMKKVAPAEIDRRVAGAMELVQIAPLADRKPAEISGGQKQRVALARALINEPQVLLLDEPLGALDLKLRKELQVELSVLQRRLGMTFVYVTHDQEEALVMSDRIAVMRAGRIEQLDESRRLYERPRTRFVGQFLGSCNVLEASVRERRGESAVVDTPVGSLRVEAQDAPAASRHSFSLAIRPEKVAVLPSAEAPGENRVPVRVVQLIYIGSETHYVLEAGATQLTAYAMNAGAGSPAYAVGDSAVAFLPASALVVLED
ncbi:MAG: ABC transporter ATP-binding protein [Acidobacteriota bacterium]